MTKKTPPQKDPRKVNGRSAYDAQDSAYMSPVAGALSERPKGIAPVLLWCIFLFLLSFFIWAYFAEIDQVTRASGRIIPARKVQTVDHLEGGIISEIFVKEGDVVSKGQPLLRIDNPHTENKLQQGQLLYLQAYADVCRLRALLSGKPLEFPEFFQKKAPHLAQEARTRFTASKASFQAEVDVLAHEIAQQQQILLEMKSVYEQLKAQYMLLEEEITLTKKIKGSNVKLDLVRLEREKSQLQSEVEAAALGIPRIKTVIEQAALKQERLKINFRNQLISELKAAEKRLTHAQSQIHFAQKTLGRRFVRAPVNGTVKHMLVNTLGSAVGAGEDLVKLVPSEDNLLIEVGVNPADVGFLHPGLEAVIQITAYDFGTYGGLKGTVKDISADTVEGANHQNVFRVRLETQERFLNKKGERLPLVSGMTASVDIITGKKTVLNALLNPLIKARIRALKEG